MDAGAQDIVRFLEGRVGELRQGETGLHGSDARIHPARVENSAGIEAVLDPRRQGRRRRRLRLEDRH